VNSNTSRPASCLIYITYPSSPFPVPRYPRFSPWILLTGNDGTDPIGPSSPTLSHPSKLQTYFLHFPPLPRLPLLSQLPNQCPKPASPRTPFFPRPRHEPQPERQLCPSSRHPPPTERGGPLKLSVSERECLTRHSGSASPNSGIHIIRYM
jgi:hypothetical protein